MVHICSRNHTKSVKINIDTNAQRIADLSAALDKERDRLLETFYRLEETIGKLQNNLSAIGQIQSLTPLRT